MPPAMTGHPKILWQDRVEDLTPVPLKGPETSEDYLQRLLHDHPGVLPIDEISAAWGPLVPLGREIGVPGGFIDNLFVSPNGELTVVEAKLWRNPEARRKVIGQILDYAAVLAAMSYQDLDDVVQTSTGDERSIWQRVSDSHHAPHPDSESGFVDNLSRNLRTGRFLLLVVGDGIRSDLHGLADLLSRHPTLGFHLELIELRLYSVPREGILVIPARVARTEEVSRGIVEIRNPDAADVTVSVSLPTPPGRTKGGRYASVGDLIADLADAVGTDRAKATADLIAWWQVERRGIVKLSKRSLNLGAPYRHTPGGSVSVMTIYNDGKAEGSIAPMSLWRRIISQEDAQARYELAGFYGDPEFPRIDLDCSKSDQREQIKALMTWADDLIRSASKGAPPVIEDPDPRG